MNGILIFLVIALFFLTYEGIMNPEFILRKKYKFGRLKIIIGSICSFLILFLFLELLNGDYFKPKSRYGVMKVETEKKTIPRVSLAEYTIEEEKVLDRKAMGKNSLYDFTVEELQGLPINKKRLYKIAFTDKLKEEQIKPTVKSIIDKLTKEDNDIDEVILHLYSNAEVLDYPFDIGQAIWAKNGELGYVTSRIAVRNDRTGYLINYDIDNNLSSYLVNKNKVEDKYGYTEAERKDIFKEIAELEYHYYGIANADSKEVLDEMLRSDGANYDREAFGEYQTEKMDEADKLINEGYEELAERYEISVRNIKDIIQEGIDDNWPEK